MKPTIVLDLDGVLVEFCAGFTAVAQELGLVKEQWTTAEQETWNFRFHVDPVWREIDRRPSFWLDLEPIHRKAWIPLRDVARDFNFVYATGRQGATAAEQTLRWLKDWNYPQGLLFMAEPKTDKLPILLPHKHQIVGVLDDKPDVVTALRKHGVPVTVRSWQYNADLDGPRTEWVAEFVASVC